MAEDKRCGCAEYFAPTDLREACSLAADLEGDAVIMIRGRPLGQANGRKEENLCAVELKDIAGLDGIHSDEKGNLRIGSLTPLVDVAAVLAGGERLSAIARAALDEARIRGEEATAAEALVNGTAREAFFAALRGLGAKISVSGADHEQICPAAEFYRDGALTILEAGDIVKSIDIPAAPPGGGR